VNSPRIILLATVCLTLAACDSYMDERYLVRRDTATSSSGDSVASNSAVQIPDPWPRGSNNPNIAFDGEKIRCAVKRYREDKEFLPPTGAIPPNATTSTTPGAAPGAGSSAGADSGCSPTGAGAAAAGSAMGAGSPAPPGQGY
jgi:hypothetical protein